MSYFDKIIQRADKLNKIGQQYLDNLPFISDENVVTAIYNKAVTIFNEHNRNWETIPEWVAQVLDEGVPYSHAIENGSLHYTLGWAITAQSANLRNYLEVFEGRESEHIKLQMLAKLP